MAEWLIEHGIGEDRAILIEGGDVLAARLNRHGSLAAGLVADVKLIARASGSRRGTVLFDNGEEALVDGLPAEAREGSLIRVIVTRSAIAETGRYKRAQARPAKEPPRAAPSLADALTATGRPVRRVRRFPQDPWPEIIGEAADGHVSFAGGSLQVSSTPAMTLIDVDGTLPAVHLASAAVPIVAATISRLDLAGSIGIDFPTLERREERRALDEAISSALAHWPHQRTAMNGFGFVQLVARLERPSILNIVRQSPAITAALLVLRQAEAVDEPGSILVKAHPAAVAAIDPAWRQELSRRTGRLVRWETDAELALLGGFAQALAS